MAEWLVEHGIGESRAIRLDGETIVAARIVWPGRLAPGLVEDAQLSKRLAGSPRGLARFANGESAWVDRLPRDASEGAILRLEVIRAGLSEAHRQKPAIARPTEAATRAAPDLAEQLTREGHTARIVHRFPRCDWDELLGEAFAGETAFPGGSLYFAPTPAMLLIDIDGFARPRELALAAVPALAASLRRFDCGGMIGVDFPSLPTKAERREVDEALGAQLASWAHERTAMNGFGFVQLVARLERPSLLHLAAHHRAQLAARALLRRAEGLEGAGRVQLAAHPAVVAALTPEWRAQLQRRLGRDLVIESKPQLAIEAPQAQLVPL